MPKKYSEASKMPKKYRSSNSPPIEREMLLNLLKSEGSTNGVARILDRDKATVRRYIKYYNIQTQEQRVSDLIKLYKYMLSSKEFPPFKKRNKSVIPSNEVLVNHISDWHFGAKENMGGEDVYNIEIAKNRAEQVCDKMIKLAFDHAGKSTEFSKIIIAITADMVEGEGIYPTQSYDTELDLPEQVMAVTETLFRYILELMKTNLPIEIYGVKGNHGRLSKEANPDSNFDILAYMVLESWIRIKQLKNVKIIYSKDNYLNFNVFDWRIQLRHKAPRQIITPSGRAKLEGWSNMHGIDAMLSGHWHDWGITPCNKIKFIQCGSLKGRNDLSEEMAVQSDISQNILGISKKYLPTFFYPVILK